MAETILTPGKDNGSNTEQTPIVDPGYLVKDKLLSEFKTEAEKSVARHNLGVLSAEDVYTKEEVEPVIVEKISKEIAGRLDSFDYITEKDILILLENLIKSDGSTPFTSPQAGVEPVSNHDLATKIYVDKLVLNCLKLIDRESILEQVANTLRSYVKLENVYTKNEVFTKDLIKSLNAKYVKIDGSTPFECPQSGRSPQISSHLTTKGYVDSLLQAHKNDIDPHGFTEKMNTKLRRYVLKDSVYDRSQTYSRGLIDLLIDKLVKLSVLEYVTTHTNAYDPHGIIQKLKDLGYITNKGTIAFLAPQKGVDAVNPDELVTLRQLLAQSQQISKLVEDFPLPIWVTSGPVESTVGHIEDNTILPEQITFQELMDAIFYGKRVKLTVPDAISIGSSFPITLCIQGTLENVAYVEIYLDSLYLDTVSREQLTETGCITLESLPTNTDLEILAKVFYTNGSTYEVSKIVRISLPIFVGIIPKWEGSSNITYEQLEQLVELDSNNQFYYNGKDVKLITHPFNFDSDVELKIIVALPSSYSSLLEMSNSAQVVTKAAFDTISAIPLKILHKDEVYKIYIYKQDLFSLNTTMNFKFG